MEEPLGDDVLRMRVTQVRVALGHVEVERGEVEQAKVQKGQAAQQANKQEPRIQNPKLSYISKKGKIYILFWPENCVVLVWSVRPCEVLCPPEAEEVVELRLVHGGLRDARGSVPRQGAPVRNLKHFHIFLFVGK